MSLRFPATELQNLFHSWKWTRTACDQALYKSLALEWTSRGACGEDVEKGFSAVVEKDDSLLILIVTNIFFSKGLYMDMELKVVKVWWYHPLISRNFPVHSAASLMNLDPTGRHEGTPGKNVSRFPHQGRSVPTPWAIPHRGLVDWDLTCLYWNYHTLLPVKRGSNDKTDICSSVGMTQTQRNSKGSACLSLWTRLTHSIETILIGRYWTFPSTRHAVANNEPFPLPPRTYIQ